MAFCNVVLLGLNAQTSLSLSPNQIQSYVAEVYGETFVSNNPTLVSAFGKLLNDRIEIRQEGQNADEKYPLLSSLGVNNKINPNLTAFSGGFQLSTFNPLRYNFDFFSNQTQIIRVDNTDYLMIVQPQN